LTDSQSLAAAYTQLAARYGEPSVSSHAAAPFTVVLLDPPSGLLDLQHLVRLEKGGPVIPPPPPEPEPEVEDVREANDKVKGKRKRRGKRKRKGKRRAHLPLEQE
jgi:hypothetical protein